MAETKDGKAAIDSSPAPSAMESLDAKTTSRCYLLELPPELRNEICKLVLQQPKGVKVNLKTGCVDRKDIALTFTNKQLRQECGNLYFAVNCFIFYFTYVPNTTEDMTYECLDEKAAFNYFVRRHAANLREVRLGFEGLDEVQRIVWEHGEYFLGNFAPFRSGLKALRSNNVRTRLSLDLDLERISFDITLTDKNMARKEIQTQLRDAAGEDVDIYLLAEEPHMIDCMQNILINVLYGKYTLRLCCN